jgi:hypothetical protein
MHKPSAVEAATPPATSYNQRNCASIRHERATALFFYAWILMQYFSFPQKKDLAK